MGTITAIAMTEPGTGSDLQGIKTKAVRDGDDWVLNGSKTFITNGINADLIIVVVGVGFHSGVIPHGHTTAVIRLVRIMRLTRVVEMLPGLEILMRGFLTGLRSCMWVLAITMLFLLMGFGGSSRSELDGSSSLLTGIGSEL